MGNIGKIIIFQNKGNRRAMRRELNHRKEGK